MGLSPAKLDAHDPNAQAFDNFMYVLVTSRACCLDIRCPHHPQTLSQDESRLLQAIGLLQNDDVLQATETLPRWLPATGIRLALAEAGRFVRALTACDLVVPLQRLYSRHWESADMVARLAGYGQRVLH